MSFDHLQKLIRKRKNPVALTLGAVLRAVPPCLRDGNGPEARAQAQLRYAQGLMDALGDLVPAVLLRVPYWEELGWQGMKALEQTVQYAHEKGLFVIADARRGDGGGAASAYGRGWLGREGFKADCLTVSAYQGSDTLEPLLSLCREEDKCVLALVRTAGAAAGEVQDLVSGDRVVCQVLGDLAQRLAGDEVGEMGYSRVGAVVTTPWPSDLRSLRKRLDRLFFLVDVETEGGCALSDAHLAFDKYGRGALVAYDAPVRAWMENGGDGADYAGAARASLTAARDEIKQSVTLL